MLSSIPKMRRADVLRISPRSKLLRFRLHGSSLRLSLILLRLLLTHLQRATKQAPTVRVAINSKSVLRYSMMRNTKQKRTGSHLFMQFEREQSIRDIRQRGGSGTFAGSDGSHGSFSAVPSGRFGLLCCCRKQGGVGRRLLSLHIIDLASTGARITPGGSAPDVTNRGHRHALLLWGTDIRASVFAPSAHASIILLATALLASFHRLATQ
jgi:hypothetical protein